MKVSIVERFNRTFKYAIPVLLMFYDDLVDQTKNLKIEEENVYLKPDNDKINKNKIDKIKCNENISY